MARSIDSFSGDFAFLSNFYFSPLYDCGHSYTTVEHAYQAAKTIYLEDFIAIRDASTPGLAKKLGRKVAMRPDWEGVKLRVMRRFVRFKFDAFPVLRQSLRETEGFELIEGNYWGDTYWGVCQGKGRNHLGRMLMQIREEILESDRSSC